MRSMTCNIFIAVLAWSCAAWSNSISSFPQYVSEDIDQEFHLPDSSIIGGSSPCSQVRKGLENVLGAALSNLGHRANRMLEEAGAEGEYYFCPLIADQSRLKFQKCFRYQSESGEKGYAIGVTGELRCRLRSSI